jgi:1-acyl-sn-glycerol-3-phosphate acyltransferase
VSWLAARRGFILAVSLFYCFLRFLITTLAGWARGNAVTPQQRAEWMHFCGRVVLRAMGIAYRIEGTIPTAPTLVVANHLSYLDIVICSAALPAAFVAKREIGSWPAFGPLSRMGGAIYLDRSSRASAWEAADTMSQRLADGVTVVLFPEGTSTDGAEVLRFHSTLFAPAIERGLAVTPAAIFYEPRGEGLVERDVCWFADEPFAPHLLKVLGITGFTAVVRFGEPEKFPDRRTAAYRSHDAISAMRGKNA